MSTTPSQTVGPYLAIGLPWPSRSAAPTRAGATDIRYPGSPRRYGVSAGFKF